MSSPPRHCSFTAKSQSPGLSGPPRKKKQDASMREYLRPDEVDAMVQAARKSGRHRVRDAAIILMMFRHGLRTAELAALRWQQVDLKAGYLDVHRVKQGHDTKHPLRGPQLRLLRELQPRCGSSPRPSWCGRKCIHVIPHSRTSWKSRSCQRCRPPTYASC